VSGWIHRNFQQEVSSVGQWQAGAPTVLLDSISAHARPVALVRADEELDVIGSYATHLLLRTGDGERAGWLAGPLAALPGPEDTTIVAASAGGETGVPASPGGSD
jgi:hypothetical protein